MLINLGSVFNNRGSAPHGTSDNSSDRHRPYLVHASCDVYGVKCCCLDKNEAVLGAVHSSRPLRLPTTCHSFLTVMKSFIIPSLALIVAVVVIVEAASNHPKKNVLLHLIITDANNMLQKVRGKKKLCSVNVFGNILTFSSFQCSKEELNLEVVASSGKVILCLVSSQSFHAASCKLVQDVRQDPPDQFN